MTNANETAENDSVDPLIWACSSLIKRYCKVRLSGFDEGRWELTPSTGSQPRALVQLLHFEVGAIFLLKEVCGSGCQGDAHGIRVFD
jgi:hypothetical protein